MLKRSFEKIIIFTRRNKIILLALLIFSLLWDAALVKQGSGGWMFGGAAGGAAAGGYAASLVGGIGIVAMGSGVGIPAAAVIGLGALFGGAVGAATGGGIGALLRDQVVDLPTLFLVFCMSLGAAVVFIFTARVLRAFGRAARFRLGAIWANIRGKSS